MAAAADGDLWAFIVFSIPTMVFLGFRHALDIDHITVIDNLVSLHNAVQKTRWIGSGFSIGHMLSVLAEMVLIIYLVGSVTKINEISFFGGIIGAIALGTIGMINVYSVKKCGRTGSAILASKILGRTGMMKPFTSAIITGLIFGLGFDTASQISAITLSAFASATLGVQASLILASFFACGMIPVDTLNSMVLRSVFSRIFDTKGFSYISYALSGVAIITAVAASYEVICKSEILPNSSGPILAVVIIALLFGYSYATRRNKIVKQHII